LKVLELGGYHPSVREPHKELFHKREEQIMGGDQKVLVARMEGLKKLILPLAVLSGLLLVTSAAVWVYIGMTRG
jgi:hypothetical protein